MSGGVDSSVAAALLHEQGHEVIGVTMRLWTEERPEEFSGHQQCCSVEDIDDARRVAGQLGIRHYVMNFEQEFKEKVVDRFVAEYAAGRTPNPCVRCNEHIKYRALLDRLPALDAEFVATGHYARVEPIFDFRFSISAQGSSETPGSASIENRKSTIQGHRLLRAVDLSKDQSYVLYMLGQEQLSRLLLPIGELTKEQVRAQARRLGLDVADKPDSVEICFVPGNDYRAFVEERVALEPGELRDGDGALIGEHRGVAAYTVGQRKGLGIAVGEPRYVTGIDAARNIVTIGPEEELFADSVLIDEVSWVSGQAPAAGTALEAKARYKAEPAPAELVSANGRSAELRFTRRQRALTPGQAIAFYSGEEVLGGGTIERAWRAAGG
jgi:tRNA-specific 2-thiouridylase